MSLHVFRSPVLVCTMVSLIALDVGRASAQQVQAPALPTGPLTLEQVLEIAEARSETIAFAQAGVRRAEGEMVRARSGRYPQLSLTAAYDRALASEFEGIFDEQSVSNGDGGELTEGFEDLPFGRENTWRVSLALTQNLYTGGRLRAQADVAAAGIETASLGVTTTRAQLLFDVTQAYYEAALSDRLVAIAELTLDQAGATLKQTEAGFGAGTQPEFEVLRARVSRDNLTPGLIRERVNRDVAILRLKQMLELPEEYDLRLADSLDDERLAPSPAFAARVTPIEAAVRPAVVALAPAPSLPAGLLPDRTAVTEAAASLRLREASLDLAEAQRRPTVSLNTTYGRNAYPTGWVPTFDRTNWTVGASVTVPILTGGRQRGDEEVARAEVEQARTQLRQIEELAALDSRSAWATLVAALAVWEASGGTVQQAARAYEIADVRYRAGVSTQLELSDSRLLLQEAEANRAQAARDLQVARARVALLPDLPVGTAAPRLPALPQVVQPQRQAPGPSGVRNASTTQGAASQVGTR